MAVGKEIVSAFSGPADLSSFNLVTHKPSSETIHIKKSKERLQLESLYQQVRDFRESKNRSVSRTKILEQLVENYPEDWLLPIELYELAFIGNETMLCDKISKHLETIKHDKPEYGKLIDNGISIIEQSLVD